MVRLSRDLSMLKTKLLKFSEKSFLPKLGNRKKEEAWVVGGYQGEVEKNKIPGVIIAGWEKQISWLWGPDQSSWLGGNYHQGKQQKQKINLQFRDHHR